MLEKRDDSLGKFDASTDAVFSIDSVNLITLNIEKGKQVEPGTTSLYDQGPRQLRSRHASSRELTLLHEVAILKLRSRIGATLRSASAFSLTLHETRVAAFPT